MDSNTVFETEGDFGGGCDVQLPSHMWPG